MALDALICVGNEKYLTAPEDVSLVTSLCRSQRVEEGLWDAIKDTSSHKKRTRLMYAAKTNDVQRIQFLLARNASINFRNVEGRSALHYACEYGHMEACKELLHHSTRGRGRPEKIQLNIQDFQGVTPLMKSTSIVEMVDYLITHGADPLITDFLHKSVLHIACGQYGNEDSAEYLIANYPELCSYKTKTGYTALHAAVKYKTITLVKLLLPLSEIDAVNDNGHTALSIAIKTGKIGMVVALLEAGAQWSPPFQLHHNPDWMPAQGTFYVDSPLHFAAKYNKVDILQYLLLHRQCSVKSLNDEGESAFWRACRQGSVEAMRILYPISDVTQGCFNGWSPLHIAVLGGHYQIVEYFCLHHANVNYTIPWNNRDGDTALVVACENNFPDIVRLLVNNMTRIELQANGFTPMQVAIRHGLSKVVTILLQAKANCSKAMEFACETNQSKIVEILLAHGHKVNTLVEGMTPLMLASRAGALATMQLLLRNGADRNFVSDTGETALTVSHDDVRDSIIQLVCNI